MRLIYAALVSLVAMAFLVAVAMVLVPMLTPTDRASSFATVADDTVPQGRYHESERRDLRPDRADEEIFLPVVVGAQQFRIRYGGHTRAWTAYAGDRATGPRPVVFLFHESGHSGLSQIDMWQEVADQHGILLVAPEGIDGNWTPGDIDPGFIHAVLAGVQETFEVNQDRIFLFGHSDGAMMAQMVANHVQGPWRGVAVHAGYVHPDWLRPIQNAPPIRAYFGTADEVFTPTNARLAGQHMARAGHDIEIVYIPSHTHWFYEGGPEFAADAWHWFRSL